MSRIRVRRYLAFLPSALFSLLLVSGLAFARAAQSGDTSSATPAQLEALSGEYTLSSFPDVPFSFYVKDGKLVVESDSWVPTELDTLSPLAFEFPHSHATFRFLLDAQGRGESAI